MAIGPALPPHLSKRKRDSDSEDSDSSNESRKRRIGPTLPPSVTANPEEIELGQDDSSEDEGPQPAQPTDSTARSPPEHTVTNAKVIGPAMPPPRIEKEDTTQNQEATNAESDSDDDFGPAPAPIGDARSAVDHTHDLSANTIAPQTSTSDKLQRDDWMLTAPAGGDWTSRVDPTKLRNRRFNTSSKSGSSSGPSTGTDMWSETPEQKRQRLQNQVLGVQGPEDRRSQPQQSELRAGSRKDEEAERRIRDYNQANRGPSLFDQHQKTRDKAEEDDPSKRAFDREKDIGGVSLSSAKKREMVGRAADFGSKFSKGSYL